jgi:hypothetical protein
VSFGREVSPGVEDWRDGAMLVGLQLNQASLVTSGLPYHEPKAFIKLWELGKFGQRNGLLSGCNGFSLECRRIRGTGAIARRLCVGI